MSRRLSKCECNTCHLPDNAVPAGGAGGEAVEDGGVGGLEDGAGEVDEDQRRLLDCDAVPK